jgi:hypothetical protein
VFINLNALAEVYILVRPKRKLFQEVLNTKELLKMKNGQVQEPLNIQKHVEGPLIG